jgi:glycosyltransferase involved in cell wall biosynthesis
MSTQVSNINSDVLVTICIPNYNKAAFVERTLKSVYNQTYRNIELIIIDDCSTDNSSSIIETLLKDCPFEFTFLKNETNRGVCFGANKGVQLAKGKYFQVLSSDDIILPDKIAHQVSILENTADDTAFIYSPIKIIDEEDSFIEKNYFEDIGWGNSEVPSGNIYEALLGLNFIPALTTLIKTNCIKNVGSYDEQLRSEDWEMSLLLSQKYKVIYDEKITAYYRVEKNSLMHSGNNKAIVYDSFCKTLIKHAGQNKQLDQKIFKNISKFALIIYANDGSTGNYWLKKSLLHSFSLKQLIYTITSYLHIKHATIKKWN